MFFFLKTEFFFNHFSQPSYNPNLLGKSGWADYYGKRMKRENLCIKRFDVEIPKMGAINMSKNVTVGGRVPPPREKIAKYKYKNKSQAQNTYYMFTALPGKIHELNMLNYIISL